MIIIYMRASSSKQTTESQKPDLERWNVGNGPAEWFEDIASGKSMDRPAWKQVEELIDAGKVKTLVVWRLDRLGRTAAGLVQLFDKLTEKGVNLVSIKDGIDLSTPAGRLIANVLASVAAYENEVKAERVIAGMQAAKANGKTIGGGKTGRHSDHVKSKAKKMVRMYNEDWSIRRIARECEVSRDTVYRVLRGKGLLDGGQ